MAGKKGRGKRAWYTVYRAYRDQLVVIGFAEECAAYLGWTVNGWTVNCFISTVSKVKAGKNKAYCVVVEDLITGSYEVYGSENDGDPKRCRKCENNSLVKVLYEEGYSDAEIASRIGACKSSVRGWRNKRCLPPNVRKFLEVTP